METYFSNFPSRKKTFEEIEFIVPQYYAAALCLGDFSGYANSAINEIENFIQSTVKKYGEANFIYDFDFEPEFRSSNDINGIGCDICRITILIEKK